MPFPALHPSYCKNHRRLTQIVPLPDYAYRIIFDVKGHGIDPRMNNIYFVRLDAYTLQPGLFMKAKHVHGIPSLTFYNGTPNNHPIRSEPA